jgi:integrase/recombinase XerC
VRQAAITAVLDLSQGDVRAAARFSRHVDIQTLTVYEDNRRDLGGKMARLVAASL